jgi:uncharacterized protein (DUF3820 family)
MAKELIDESLMPWGKFKGTKMIDVPYWHLLWLYDNKKCDFTVRKYIEDNMDALLLEKKNNE